MTFIRGGPTSGAPSGWRHRILYVLVVLAGLASLVAIALGFFLVFRSHGAASQAVATVILTGALVVVTGWYTHFTRELVRSQREDSDRRQEQAERHFEKQLAQQVLGSRDTHLRRYLATLFKLSLLADELSISLPLAGVSLLPSRLEGTTKDRKYEKVRDALADAARRMAEVLVEVAEAEVQLPDALRDEAASLSARIKRDVQQAGSLRFRRVTKRLGEAPKGEPERLTDDEVKEDAPMARHEYWVDFRMGLEALEGRVRQHLL